MKMKSQTQILPITTPYPYPYPYSPSSNDHIHIDNPMATTLFLHRPSTTTTTTTTTTSSFLDNDHDLPTTRLLIQDTDYNNNNSITQIERKPLISRALSFTGLLNNNSLTSSSSAPQQPQQHRRRRSVSDDNLTSLQNGDVNGDHHHGGGGGAQSIVDTVEHAAVETYTITRLSLKLLSYLGVGYRWITRFLALGCYAILLMPGFIQVGYHYFFSSQIRRSVIFSDQPRNRLDLYLPKNSNGPKPVVAFVTGGAWIIGYKAWGSLLGQQLSERDIIVACIDYRNFPQGTIRDMIDDASRGIAFICNNIADYGGDPNRIYLMGQSAGAHIAACTLVEQAIKETGEGENVSWSVSQIKAYFGLSGGYNLLNLVDHFHHRGLYRSIFLGIMEGEQSLQLYSPEIVVQNPSFRNAISRLPPITLFHGTADYSIPSDASTSFAETLQRLGVEARAVLYEGKTHTDVFLQDPMRGGSDQMFEDLVATVHAGDDEALAKHAMAPPRRRLVPEIMLKLARAVSPF